MKKYLVVFFIITITVFMQIFGLTTDSNRKLILNITSKNKASHEKVFLNKNAGKYEKLLLYTENNSIEVKRLKLEFDDGSDLVISENIFVSRDDNYKEVYINKPGRILIQISVNIVSREDKAERTVFNIYAVKWDLESVIIIYT